MAIEYSFDQRASILSFASLGDISVQERADAIARAIRDKSLPEQCDILIDVTGVSREPLAEDNQLIAALLRLLRERFGRRIAIITGGRAVSHTTGILIAFLADNSGERSLRSFTSKEEAFLWLCTVV
jgi:hypothetical protein